MRRYYPTCTNSRRKTSCKALTNGRKGVKLGVFLENDYKCELFFKVLEVLTDRVLHGQGRESLYGEIS